MSFWLQQARARRHALIWILLFAVLVVLVLLGVNLVYWGLSPWLPGSFITHFYIINITVAALMLLVAFSHYVGLRQGGHGWAQQLGARPLTDDKLRPQEQCLRDVCAEMAVASMQTVPAVYVLYHEPGINAMVAGLRSEDTVLIVTEGALQHLGRDELQAMMGHEFSHLAEGDALLNLRLMITLSGLHALYRLGQVCIDWSSAMEGRGFILSWGLFGIGQGVRLLGLGGVFLGRGLCAGISREREFLADATGVQWTRHKDAMISLLMVLREHPEFREWQHGRAEEFSHMCFVSQDKWQRWLSSHPPLEERVQALDPLALVRWRSRQRQIQHTNQLPVNQVDHDALSLPFVLHQASTLAAMQPLLLLGLCGAGTTYATELQGVSLVQGLALLEISMAGVMSLQAGQQQQLVEATPVNSLQWVSQLRLIARYVDYPCSGHAELKDAVPDVARVMAGWLQAICKDTDQHHFELIMRTLGLEGFGLPEKVSWKDCGQTALRLSTLARWSRQAIWDACQDAVGLVGVRTHEEEAALLALAELWQLSRKNENGGVDRGGKGA